MCGKYAKERGLSGEQPWSSYIIFAAIAITGVFVVTSAVFMLLPESS
jgi:hypothetical protein